MRHLIPKQLTEHGLGEDVLLIPKEAVKLISACHFLNVLLQMNCKGSTYFKIGCKIVSGYTREAGVRSMERKIGALCRAVAVKVAERKVDVTDIGMDNSKGRKIKPGLESKTVDLPCPPEMPIILDENAIEDILGVS